MRKFIGTPKTYPARNSDTVMLLHCNGSTASPAFIDESGKTFTAVNATLHSTTKQFGETSGYFNGSAYITTTGTTGVNFGTNDFCVQCSICPTVLSTNHHKRIFGAGDAEYSVPTVSVALQIQPDNTVSGAIASGSTYCFTTSTMAVSLNTWTQLAFVRYNGNLGLFVNGVLTGGWVAANVTVNNSTYPYSWGRHGNYAANYYTGYIDEMLVQNKRVNHTTDYTVEHRPFY